MDGPTFCDTDRDAVAAAREGSPAAPLLQAVNFVADAIKEEFPAVRVHTLAYLATQPAPIALDVKVILTPPCILH
jgi:hypothetical protein